MCSRGEPEAVFHLGVVHVQRTAEQFGRNARCGDFQQPVELVGFDGDAVVHNRMDAGSAGEKLNEECFRLDRIIRVVGIHAFVVFRKDGVVD